MIAYSYVDKELPIQKIELPDYLLAIKPDSVIITTRDTASVDSTIAQECSLDTTAKRILFFGDSMIEGLGPRLCDYATENGHELHTVCWYSSTTEHWAVSDTLEYFLNKIKPDYIMISIGGNEQFITKLDKQTKNINIIKKKLGKIPTIWICTPEWNKNVKFNIMLQEQVGDSHFFDSRRLSYERQKDHAHPTRQSASAWMDSIAVWMQSDACAHPILMNKPAEKRARKWDAVYMKPTSLSKL